MSKEVRDYRADTGEESLWTSDVLGIFISNFYTSNGNLIQYVDKILDLG